MLASTFCTVFTHNTVYLTFCPHSGSCVPYALVCNLTSTGSRKLTVLKREMHRKRQKRNRKNKHGGSIIACASLYVSKRNQRMIGGERNESGFLKERYFPRYLKNVLFVLIFKMIIDLGRFRNVNCVNQSKLTIPQT